MHRWAALLLLGLALVLYRPVSAAEPFVDVVTLKDGSLIFGEVVEMSGGLLHIKSPAAEETIKVKWSEVSKLKVTHPTPFHLKEGTVLVGTADEGEPGTMQFKAEPMEGSLTVPLDSVLSVNPLIQPPVTYVGSLQGGYSQTTGNSRLRNFSLIGEFVGRSEQLRLTILVATCTVTMPGL